jgi:23S rRNA (uracil1939-C5)-methyltransferase
VRNKKSVLQNLPVTDYAAEGKAVARINGKVVFVEGAVPGDIADVLVTKNKKDWAEGKAIRFEKYSEDRIQPFCIHFGVCGGCKWQMLPYQKQLEYKQQEAEQNLRRIGKVEIPEILPIIGADETVYYRNKLEFTFSNRRYLLPEEIKTLPVHRSESLGGALGYHAPNIFDKVIDIRECHLMDCINNTIRNLIRTYAIENNLSYYDIKNHTGWLRNIIVRYTTTQQLMVNIVIGYDDAGSIKKLAGYLLKQVPEITTLLYTVNSKWNDSIYDLAPQLNYGNGFIIEELRNHKFKISPKSFFQTNTKQAIKLYDVAGSFANLTGNEIVYDLYCGTGSIGIYLSKRAKKIIGVDVIDEAIKDAKENAVINNITHAHFFTGDVIDICTDEFFILNGKPDVVILDPPRAGITPKLVQKLLNIAAQKIVYVSCNVATQARDINLLSDKYHILRAQPVDMFPHTHHIECVVLLQLKQ